MALGGKRLDDLLERHVLVGEGLERVALDLGEELPEGGTAGEIVTEGDRVDEEADDILELDPAPARHRGGHDHVLLAAVAGEQSGKAGQQGHKRRRAGLAAPLLDAFREVTVEGQFPRATTEALPLGPGKSVGQLEQRRGAGQPLCPVFELAVEPTSAQELVLPDREVGVLDGWLSELGRAALDAGTVELGQLAAQDAKRPFVDHGVVKGQGQDVLALGELDQAGPDERTASEIETLGAALREPPAGLALRVLARAGVVAVHGQRRLRVDDLHEPAVNLREGGAKRLVTGDERVEGTLQGGDIERPADAQLFWDVIGAAAGVEFFEEPETLLGEGGRQEVDVAGVGGQALGGARAGGGSARSRSRVRGRGPARRGAGWRRHRRGRVRGRAPRGRGRRASWPAASGRRARRNRHQGPRARRRGPRPTPWPGHARARCGVADTQRWPGPRDPAPAARGDRPYRWG